MKDFTASLSCFLIADLNVRSSYIKVSVIFEGGEEASGWGDLGWWIRAEFPLVLFACLEATEPISLMFTFA